MGAVAMCVPKKHILAARHSRKQSAARKRASSSYFGGLFRGGMSQLTAEQLKAEDANMTRVEQEWRIADKDLSGTLSKREIRLLLRKLNVPPMKEATFSQVFASFDLDGSGELSRDEFGLFFQSMQSFPDVMALFREFASGSAMLPAELQRLLLATAGDEIPAAEAERLISKYEAAANEGAWPREHYASLSPSGLARLLGDSLQNRAWGMDDQDLTRPLSHYFINSSHNTYITGNQFSSAASADAVRRALLSGVRVVELDVFDAGQTVVVSHKNSMVSQVLFEDCVQAIADSGFTASDLPVILTLENHCSMEGQRRIVEILVRVLGPLLFRAQSAKEARRCSMEGEDSSQDGYATATEEEEEEPQPRFPSDLADGDDSDDDTETEAPTLPASSSFSWTPPVWLSPQQLHDQVIVRDKATKRCTELLELVYIKNCALQARSDAALGLAFPKRQGATSSSVAEGRLAGKLGSDKAVAAMCAYTTQHLVRAYPAGSRVDSSNYEPDAFWRAGVQIVALNVQTHDEPCIANRGMFRGSRGYVLKPDAVVGRAAPPAPCRIRVTVVSGHNINKPEYRSDASEIIDPYVVVRLTGGGEAPQTFRTPIIMNNGHNPAWNCAFEFRVARPDLALLVFKVMESEMVGTLLGQDDFCSCYAFPVSKLRLGFRAVPLEFVDGRPVPHAFLFLRFELVAS